MCPSINNNKKNDFFPNNVGLYSKESTSVQLSLYRIFINDPQNSIYSTPDPFQIYACPIYSLITYAYDIVILSTKEKVGLQKDLTN